MFYCNFPGCNYTTLIKSQIHSHHIVPKANKGSNKSYNLITVCPTHHSKIFIDINQIGIHSKYSEDSIIMHQQLSSSKGLVLEYSTLNSKALLYSIIKK